MMPRLFIIQIVLSMSLISACIYAQDFEGYYTGKLLSEDNLLVVDKDKKGNYFIELHSSSKNVYKLDATTSDDCLIFLLPTIDGIDLNISSVKTEDGLQLSFTLSEEKYTTHFKKITLPRKNPAVTYFKEIEKVRYMDANLIGDWQLIGSYGADGNLIKDEFSNKKYVTTFLKDGTYHEDPRLFWDFDKQHGLTDRFRPTDIPKGNWRTNNNEILKRSMGAYDFENEYKVANDTLRIFSTNGIKLIYTKK